MRQALSKQGVAVLVVFASIVVDATYDGRKALIRDAGFPSSAAKFNVIGANTAVVFAGLSTDSVLTDRPFVAAVLAADFVEAATSCNAIDIAEGFGFIAAGVKTGDLVVFGAQGRIANDVVI